MAPIAKAAIARPSITAYGSAASRAASVLDGRVRAVAVGDDVALVRGLRGGGAPLLARGEAGPAAAPEPGPGDRGDGPDGAVVPDRTPEALEGAGADGGVEVGRVGGDGGHAPEQDARPVTRRGEEAAHQLARPP